MPPSELHRKKLKKNLVIGALIFFWCALIWMVTMVRIANAQEPVVNNHIYYVEDLGVTYRGRNYSGINIRRLPVDVKIPMYNTRNKHNTKSAGVKLHWDETFHSVSDARQLKLENRETARMTQQNKVVTAQDGWVDAYLDKGEARLQFEHDRDLSGREHTDTLDKRLEDRWAAWVLYDQEKERLDSEK